MKRIIPIKDREPCFKHEGKGKGYKKGCKECHEKYKDHRDEDHDELAQMLWERDHFD